MQTGKTLIRLGGCLGRSETWHGAHGTLFVLSYCSPYNFICYCHFTILYLLSLAEDSLETTSLIFSEKNEKVFMNVVCCSRDWSKILQHIHYKVGWLFWV